MVELTEELAKKRKERSKPEIAIALLYSQYEVWLGEDSFLDAINLVEDEVKATVFTAMRPGSKRDRWLETHINADLEPLS